MNGSRSLNLSGHLLMSPGVSTALGGGGGSIPRDQSLLSPLLRSQWGLAAFSRSERENLRARITGFWYLESSLLHTLIYRRLRRDKHLSPSS